MQLLGHLKDVLSISCFASLKFKTQRGTREVSVRLWEGDRLMDLCLVCCGRNIPEVKSQLTMVAKFLGVVSK